MEKQQIDDVKDSQGLHQDIQQMLAHRLTRRNVLILGAGGIASLVTGCGGGSDDSSSSSTSSGSTSSSTTSSTSSSTSSSSSTSTTTSTTTDSTCPTEIPEETAGPYPADGSTASGKQYNVLTLSGIVRSDITTSITTGTVSKGVPLTLKIKLVDVSNSCAAIEGYAIYLWHCNFAGLYSLYSTGLESEDYLRGVQVTDSEGYVTFETFFPACYSGRWPHIHFEVYPSLSVATTANNKIKTSQFAMPESVAKTIYSGSTYYTSSTSNLSQITLATDNVFGDGYETELIAASAFDGSVSAGYSASMVVGISI